MTNWPTNPSSSAKLARGQENYENKFMKKICEKCGQEVPENQVVEFPVYLKGGQTLEPQLFEHKNCGGEVTEKQEKN